MLLSMVTCIFGWNRSLHSVLLECACLNVFSCRERDAHTYPPLCSLLFSIHLAPNITPPPPQLWCAESQKSAGVTSASGKHSLDQHEFPEWILDSAGLILELVSLKPLEKLEKCACGDISAKWYYVALCSFHDTFKGKCAMIGTKSVFSLIWNWWKWTWHFITLVIMHLLKHPCHFSLKKL